MSGSEPLGHRRATDVSSANKQNVQSEPFASALRAVSAGLFRPVRNLLRTRHPMYSVASALPDTNRAGMERTATEIPAFITAAMPVYCLGAQSYSDQDRCLIDHDQRDANCGMLEKVCGINPSRRRAS